MSDDALRITIDGREYPVEPPFTNRELHLIKQIANVRAGEFFDAMQAGDSDILVALAHIGLRRAGATRPTLDELWELPATAIGLITPESEDAAADPTTAANGGEQNNGSPATVPSSLGSPLTDTSST